MSFSPVNASKKITEKYYRYLKTSFRMGEPYRKEFEYLIDKGETFAAGPYLDVTDAFKKGCCIKDLIDEGILPSSFSHIHMNQERPLYKHQENAIRKIVLDGRNVVVSTGTGSGKTECFLIPILSELAVEAEQKALCPGVRALLIYPMNALANDQTERLRTLLADYPEITFGTYTGQTKHSYQDALSEYMELNNYQRPIVNELISREQMIKTPPHILITNYAMLEYLMLRPRDSVFFDGEKAKDWRFIVFDEAHVYNGSTGIEVSMLFRRLKAKLGNRKLNYVLTSATLGEKEDDEAVADFAQKLCSAPFSKNDIIRAERILPEAINEPHILPISIYENIAKARDTHQTDAELLKILGCPSDASLSSELYNTIVHDKNYWKIRSLLKTPRTVSFLMSQMGWSEKQLSDFVSVASLAEKDGGKLFDARYHMFLRATESVFITLAPDNKVMLHRSDFRHDYASGISYKVFEAASCSYCNSVYLVGKRINNRLEQYNQTDELSEKELYLLSEEISDTDEDHTMEAAGIDAEEYLICPYCGYLVKNGSKNHCEHNSKSYVKVYRVSFTTERRILTKCLRCENVNSSGVLRMFFSGQEASTSVIGTALFEELPSYSTVIKTNDNDKYDEDDFGVYEEETVRNAKQFIAFSDSRQAAAFFASYFSITYNSILYKRLIVEALSDANKDGYSVPAFVDRVQTQFEKNHVVGKKAFEDDSEYSISKEAWKAVLAELIDNNGNTSLSRFGLFGIELDVKGNYKKFSIRDDEFQVLCSAFSVSMMQDAAIDYDAPLNETDLEEFTHGGVEYAYTLSDSNEKKHIKSFIPTRAGLSNKRVDYLQRIISKKGLRLSNDDAAEFLKSLWEKVLIKQGILTRTGENSYRINASKIRIKQPQKWFICKKCRRLTCYNVENVCPTYHCDGELTEVTPAEVFRDNHYYHIYREMEIRDLRVVEHTAQLDRDMAYDYQKKFKQKEIDVLSCSTTFEMGVDVGSLETVFMRNMPPMPSNYAQRAGRAGRSSQSAAFALTFCNKSSHDFTFFKDPTRMIKGKIDPPRYTVENDRIAVRHLYASALSFFWKIHPEHFKTIGKFLEKDGAGKSGYDHFIEYLRSKPEDLKEFLRAFLPPVLSAKFDIEHFGWLDSLISDDGILEEAVKMYEHEVSLLESVKRERIESNGFIDSITQRIKAYQSEDILSFLSRKNILPKYGFPVDTVEMTVNVGKRRRHYGLQLQRDLSMAISEYAPGSQIVANNNLITSQYIKKLPNISWKMYNYIQCDYCKTLNIEPYTDQEHLGASLNSCCQCKKPFNRDPKVFLIPSYGFAADGDKIRKPGLKKPERTYRGEIAYVGFRNEAMVDHYNVGRAIVEVKTSHNDEMAILNTSPFYVCERCGYAEVDEKMFTIKKKKKHKNSAGFVCGNELKQFSLGYRFLTDVVRISFENYEINEYEKGLSILYGFLKGACAYLNIEENDISGCLQSYPVEDRLNYSMVIFDNTPGGAGHAKRLNDQKVLLAIMAQTLDMMKRCDCGGEEGDSSCYSCLRSYRNQKNHDVLKRKYVIEFLSSILEGAEKAPENIAK